MEDYAVVYFGSAVFKTIKLLLLAIFSVHIFACVFYRVKDLSAASREEVVDFYASRDVEADVRAALLPIPALPSQHGASLGTFGLNSACVHGRTSPTNM